MLVFLDEGKIFIDYLQKVPDYQQRCNYQMDEYFYFKHGQFKALFYQDNALSRNSKKTIKKIFNAQYSIFDGSVV